MPRRQSVPMKYWGFYASEELKAETQRIAALPEVNESDSEYIRKAVEMRNEQYGKISIQIMTDKERVEKAIWREENRIKASESKSKNEFESTLTQPSQIIVGEQESKIADKIVNPSIQSLKEQVKQMEKPQMVNPLMKGGK